MAYIGLNPQTQLLNTSTQTFSGNAAQLQFTLARSVASASDLDVMIDNTLQRPFTDYEAENLSLQFQSAPPNGTNNITVTYRAGALNSLNLTANAFGAGTVGAPSVYSVAANNTGLYWPNATTMSVVIAGSNAIIFSGNANSSSNTTGALQVVGGIGATGNINTSGIVKITNTTTGANIGTGALVVSGSIGAAGNLTIGQNITCVGDFTVNGTFTTTGTDSLEVNDPFIFLANANPGDTYDTGVISQYYDGTANRYTGYFRDITDNKYKLFGNLLTKPTTTVDTADTSFRYQDLVLSNVSATGNVSGTYFLGNGSLLSGIITSVSSIVNGTSNMSIPALNGNIIANVGGTTIATISSSVGLAVTGAVTATTTVSATGNITGGNINTAGIFSATGNITGAANVSGGNILTGGLFSAFGGITGASVSTGGAVSATGNVTGGNVNTAGLVSAGANVIGGNIRTAGQVSAAGVVYGDSFSATLGISAGTIVAATTDVTAGGDVSATGAVNAGTTISAIGNITGSYFLGNGRLLSGIDATSIQNGTSNAKVVSSGGNVTISIGGTANVAVFATTGEFVTGLISATGNIIGGNINTGGLISATGNIIGGNISTSGTSGNITGANVIAATTLSATANVVGGNISTIGLVTATGNVNGGNVISAAAISAGGLISATATITGGNLATNGTITTGLTVSATGNITGGNINTAGLVSATGNIRNGIANVLSGNAIITSLVSAATVSATGNITGGNLNAAGLSLSGNVVSSLSMVTAITTTANVTGGNLLTGGQIISTKTGSSTDASGQIFLNGLGNNRIDWAAVGTGAPAFTTRSTGTKLTLYPSVSVSNADYAIGVDISTLWNSVPGNDGSQFFKWYGGTALVGSLSSTGVLSVVGTVTGGNVTTAGLISATGNITGGNILGGANVNATLFTGTTVSVTGNITGGNVLGGANVNATTHTGTTVSVTGAITGASLTVSTGNISGGNVNNNNTTGVGNIGSATVAFNTVFAKATSAQYADLAENYSADDAYEPGTVLSFGGTNEVTKSLTAADARVAGVVSTNPAHLMNSTLVSEHVTALALTGRVPTLVVGTVRKGDMMVSAGNGHAQACATPAMGTVIGKAVEDFDGKSGTIEIVVGRI